MPETPKTSPVSSMTGPFAETPGGPPKPSRAAGDTRAAAPQKAKAALEGATNGVKAVARAAAQISPWQYLAIALRIVGLIGLFVVYQTIEAEGLREIFGDVVTKRLCHASALFLGWMDDFVETRKLDMANALAGAFLLFTFLSWEAVIYRIVHRPPEESIAERYVVLVPAIVLMVIDTILFGTGVHANGSFSSPIPALMLAVGYDAMLVLFSYWVVKIERRKP